ncbi:hypothetical protein FKM82_007943 [Ascaphus truei]
MAAPSSSVRVRLCFDYPPPAIPESCMFWLLVDVKRCRVVTDLASIVRQRFFYSRRGGLSLYVEDCLLPPGESILVIRDNDCIRVKWDEIYPEDDTEPRNSSVHLPKKSRKRPRQKSEPEEESEDDAQLKTKKQKTDASRQDVTSESDRGSRKKVKKKKKGSSLANDVSSNEQPVKSRKKMQDEESKKKKSKKREVPEEQIAAKPVRKSLPSSPTKPSSDNKARRTRTPTSSSSDSSNTSDAPLVNTAQKKSLISPVEAKKQGRYSASIPVKKSAPSSTGNAACSGKTKKKGTSSSSSDSDFSKEKVVDTTKNRDVPAASTLPLESASVSVQPPTTQPSSKASVSDSSDSDTLVIKKPMQTPLRSSLVPSSMGRGDALASYGVQGPAPNPIALGSGIGRGRGRGEDFPWRGQRGRGFRGRGRGDRGRGRGDGGNHGRGDGGNHGRGDGGNHGRGDGGNHGRGDGGYHGRGDGGYHGCGDGGNHGRGDDSYHGRGTGDSNKFFYNYETQKQQQLNESATNSSVVIQNLPVVPSRDYNVLPLLAAPPQVGKTIAFKEGRIISFDPFTQQLEVDLLSRRSGVHPASFLHVLGVHPA